MSLLNRAMRNKTIGVTLLDDRSNTPVVSEQSQDPYVNVEIAAAYVELTKDLITHAAFTIGGVWAACKIVERICK